MLAPMSSIAATPADRSGRRARRRIAHCRAAGVAAGVLTALTAAAPAGAAGVPPAAPVPVPIPAVHATTAAVSVTHHLRVLVKSLDVTGLTGQFRITCNGCRRLTGPIRRITPAKGSVRFVGVNWLLVPGHAIAVRTYRPRMLGRYEILVAAPHGVGLVFKSSGCLRSLTRRTPCPPGVGTPLDGSPVAGPVTGSQPTGGHTPPGAPGVPRTMILSGPSGSTSALPVSFTYASSAPSAAFQCALDASAWLACPAGGISYAAVVPGSHTFRVRADLAGVVDPAPPQRTWTQVASGTPPTGTPPPALLGNTVPGGTAFAAGQYLRSANGQYQLIMQGDGNLVLYTQGRALWSSGTAGHPGSTAQFQGDGNLVVYGPDGAALWNAGSVGHPGSTLALQDDGNVV
ncbi:MAG: pseudomonalisin, partial [Microbacteriaceae bacterium]|nr:pseudomonalisin [Microbacteriaceae bacterium]